MIFDSNSKAGFWEKVDLILLEESIVLLRSAGRGAKLDFLSVLFPVVTTEFKMDSSQKSGA